MIDPHVNYIRSVVPSADGCDGMASRSRAYDAVSGIQEFERLVRAVEESKLEVPIAAAYEIIDAAKAHERLAKKHVLGQIVLQVR
jgi:D-arabinose 1-dehydrogenase-like Zn-dependent alcohol dehydrogenase